MQCVCGECGYEHENAWDGTPCPQCASTRVIPLTAAEGLFGADWREVCFGVAVEPPKETPAPYGYQHYVSKTALERPCPLCEASVPLTTRTV